MKTSDVFIESLKEKIFIEKNIETKKRIILKEASEIINTFFKNDKNSEIKQIRNFETSDICYFLDVYTKEDIQENIVKLLDYNNIKHKNINYDKYQGIYVLDLSNMLLSSGDTLNLFYIQIISKRLNVYKIKIGYLPNDFCFGVIRKNYYEIKYWIYDKDNLLIDNYILKNINRDIKSHKIEHNGYYILFDLDDIGDIEKFKIKSK